MIETTAAFEAPVIMPDIPNQYYNNPMKPNNLPQHEEQMWSLLDQFEERAWSEQNEGIKTGWPAFDEALDGGFSTGWVLLGGVSNIGKTSLLSMMAWQIANANKDVYVMDFSLDDPLHDKIPRVVAAANKVLINAVKKPNNYKQYPNMLQRRKDGLDVLRKAVDRYRCYDANHGTDIDDIDLTIKNMVVNLEEEALLRGTKRKRLVVLIDNFHDLSTTAKEASGSDKMKYDYLAQRVSDMATLYDITLITTGEFKKLNGFRRPIVDDLRESIKIVYEAKLILIGHNEVGLKGEGAAIFYELDGVPTKQPVFELQFAKNKMSSFKGRLFYEFYPDIAYFEPTDSQTTQHYNNLIYSHE